MARNSITVAATALLALAPSEATSQPVPAHRVTGTPILVKDVQPGVGSGRANFLTAFHDRVVFTADDGIMGPEPWISDGTECQQPRFAGPDSAAMVTFLRADEPATDRRNVTPRTP